MKSIIFILTIILLSSCSQRAWLNRGEKRGWISKDSTIIRDTIKGFTSDTIFKTDSFKSVDTFYFNSNGIKVKTIVRYKDKTVLQTITQRDTIRIFKVAPTVNCPECKQKLTIKEILTVSGFWFIVLLAVTLYLIHKFKR